MVEIIFLVLEGKNNKSEINFLNHLKEIINKDLKIDIIRKIHPPKGLNLSNDLSIKKLKFIKNEIEKHKINEVIIFLLTDLDLKDNHQNSKHLEKIKNFEKVIEKYFEKPRIIKLYENGMNFEKMFLYPLSSCKNKKIFKEKYSDNYKGNKNLFIKILKNANIKLKNKNFLKEIKDILEKSKSPYVKLFDELIALKIFKNIKS